MSVAIHSRAKAGKFSCNRRTYKISFDAEGDDVRELGIGSIMILGEYGSLEEEGRDFYWTPERVRDESGIIDKVRKIPGVTIERVA